MARINVATLGMGTAQGEFVIGAQLKIFGPASTLDNRVDIQLSQRMNGWPRPGRYGGYEVNPRPGAYVGRLPQTRLDYPSGAVLQILWHISYVVIWKPLLMTSSPPGGKGWGNIAQSWRILPRYLPAQAAVGTRPNLTYEPRPPDPLQNAYAQNFTVVINATGHDVQTGINCGEITSRLSICIGRSERTRMSVTAQATGSTEVGSLGASIGVTQDIATSEAASFACSVGVPYSA